VSAVQGGDLRMALWRDYLDQTHIFDWRNKGRDVALAVARGLHFLHRQNVVHRQGGAGSSDCDSSRKRHRSSAVSCNTPIDRCCARLTLSRVAVTRRPQETMWASARDPSPKTNPISSLNLKHNPKLKFGGAGAQPWSMTCGAYVLLVGQAHFMKI